MEKMCKTIEESTSEFTNATWVSEAFSDHDQKGERVLWTPLAAQAAEDAKYSKQLQSGPEAHPGIIEAETTHNILVKSREGLTEGQISTSPLFQFTPVTDQMINPTSSATATGAPPTISNINMLKSLNAASPTPATNENLEEDKESASPSSQNLEVESKVRRKLSFGIDLGHGERFMPPPKARRPSPSSGDDLFAQFIDLAACTPVATEVLFRDIPASPSEDQPTSSSNNDQYDRLPPSKTPILTEFESPFSPVVIRDDTNNSYPTCYDGMGMSIPLHHLESLRKAVDPEFSNEEWANGIYFSDKPVYSSYSNRPEIYGFQSKDWNIIFHALDNGSDRQFPLPNTKTQSRFTDEQVYRIVYGLTPADQHKTKMIAVRQKHWTQRSMNRPGLMWSEVRGRYYPEGPEYAITSTEKICASPQFKTFCQSASFVEGRSLAKPNLEDARAVLRHARLPKSVHKRPRIHVINQQVSQALQPLVPANAALLRHTATPSDVPEQPYPWTASAPASSHDLAQQPADQVIQPMPQGVPQGVPHQVQQVVQAIPLILTNQTMQLNAYNNYNVFCSLPALFLHGYHTQYIQVRELYFNRQGLPVPNHPTNWQELWQFYRQQMEAQRTAAQRRRMPTQTGIIPGVPPPQVLVARDAAIRPVRLQNPQAPDAGSSLSSGLVQVQSHMSTAPLGIGENRQANGSERMMASATELGSPFLTPRPTRSDEKLD